MKFYMIINLLFSSLVYSQEVDLNQSIKNNEILNNSESEQSPSTAQSTIQVYDNQNKNDELEEIQRKIDILKKKKELLELEKSIAEITKDEKDSPVDGLGIKIESDFSFVIGGNVLFMDNLDSYFNNLKSGMKKISNELVTNHSQTISESTSSINFYIGFNKTLKIGLNQSLDIQVLYNYMSTKEVESTTFDDDEKKWLFGIKSKFYSHSLMLRSFYNIYDWDNLRIAFGAGAGVSYTKLRESIDLNTKDFSWPTSLEDYDLKDFYYDQFSFTAELMTRVNYRINNAANISFLAGYRFMKVGTMYEDKDNYEYSSSSKLETIDGESLDIDLSGPFVGIEIGLFVF